ncbi:MAG: hypothetical protein JSV39_02245 [Candidatus Aenigmatarchaeota archaeon]|nr:MAG: hypothetical protein JSV39_02245 [Candidatus Aenigmarchaeota archaeon]
MNFKVLAILVLSSLLILTPNALAETNETSGIDLEMIKDFYNNNIQSYPEVANLFANERLNLYIEGYGVVGVVTQDSEIKEMSEGELADPTVNINTDMETIEKIMNGEVSVVDELKSGDITFEGVGFWNWLKIAFANFIFSILSVFGMV